MKAWKVYSEVEYCSMIIFAETKGKAASYALSMEEFENSRFTEIEVRREEKADKYYTEGKLYMDWENPQDREILYDEFNYRCEFVDDFFCNECPIKEWCEDYQNTLEWESESE